MTRTGTGQGRNSEHKEMGVRGKLLGSNSLGTFGVAEPVGGTMSAVVRGRSNLQKSPYSFLVGLKMISYSVVSRRGQ